LHSRDIKPSNILVRFPLQPGPDQPRPGHDTSENVSQEQEQEREQEGDSALRRRALPDVHVTDDHMSLPAGHQNNHNGDLQTLSHSQLAVSEEALVRFGAAAYPTLFDELQLTDGAEESETFGAEDFSGEFRARDESSEGKTQGLGAEVRLGDFGNGVDVLNFGRMYRPRSSTQIRPRTHIHTYT
jgi:serine/threonine protein kinase